MWYFQNEDGQGLVEYAMIMLFVAIVLVFVVTILGPQVANMYQAVMQCPGPFCPT
jgi:pilus assembly protein Flp/PilA